MSDNKFTESMEVIEIGTMRLCDSVPVCANFTDVTGVLIEGITKDAAKLLYEKVEIVAEGTKAKMEELEASNKELLGALEDFVIDVEGYFGFSETDDMEPEDDVAYFIGEYRKAKRLIKKERGQG